MTITKIRELEKKIRQGKSGWELGEFTAEDVVKAFYLGGGNR